MNHDELQQQYELDVLLHPEGKPWEWWERKATSKWVSMFQEPSWYEDIQYRRKSTAPNWDEELSPKEVAECDDWPEGYYLENLSIRLKDTEAHSWYIWNQNHGWLYDSKGDNEILDHFKKRRETILQQMPVVDEYCDKEQQAAEDIVSTDPKEQAAQQKAQHYLLPPEFLKQVTAVLEHGADKYGPYNWREGDGIKQDVYISATFRHLLAIMEGEWLDPESGKSHWSHIAATAAIMVDAIKHDKLKR